MKDSYYMQ